jgi:hypothetical protein
MRKLALIALLTASFAAAADTVQLRADAPNRHIVVKGDTLWDISAKFLKSPWKWPELWQNNKAEIKNPHWIYPGDVIYLTMTQQGPRLSLVNTVKLSPTVHSEVIPDVSQAIPTIPYSAVEAFLRRPLVASSTELASAPTLIASEDGRGLLTLGDPVYATGIKTDSGKWNIVRIGKALRDPESGKEIAHELIYVGDAQTQEEGNPTTLIITGVEQEIQVGDRLLPVASTMDGIDFMPRAPERQIEGKIISAFGSSQATGKYSTVIINKGTFDGLSLGHVLAVYREGRSIGPDANRGRLASFDPKDGYIDANNERAHRVEYKNFGEEVIDFLDPFDFLFRIFPDGRRGWRYIDNQCLKPGANVRADEFHDPAKSMEDCSADKELASRKWAYMDIGCLKSGKQINFGDAFDPKDVYERHCRPENVKLPDVKTGHILIYRVFGHVAYGLVMDSSGPIYLLDTVKNP